MSRITINAWHGSTYLSLATILLALDPHVSTCRWSVRIQEAAPEPGADSLASLRSDRLLDTADLRRLVSIQVIDGEFAAFDENGNVVLVIKAIDSTYWDIETNNPDIIQAVLRIDLSNSGS